MDNRPPDAELNPVDRNGHPECAAGQTRRDPLTDGERIPMHHNLPSSIGKAAYPLEGIAKPITGVPQPGFYPTMSSSFGANPGPLLDKHGLNLERTVASLSRPRTGELGSYLNAVSILASVCSCSPRRHGQHRSSRYKHRCGTTRGILRAPVMPRLTENLLKQLTIILLERNDSRYVTNQDGCPGFRY